MSARGNVRVEPVERLLGAATVLLTRNPPSAITGRQLADAADVNYGLLHRHLGSKDNALRMALDRIIQSFLTDAFDPATDLPRPNPLRTQATYWRSLTYVALDEATFDDLHPQSPVVARYLRGLSGARPDLDRGQVELLVTLSAALHFGLSPLYRDGLAPAIGLRADDPRIDELLVQWIDGLHTGHGPLGVAPERPRRLQPTSASDGDRPPVAVTERRRPAEQQLIAAGAALLADRAPSAISGRELARAAGVNYGLIHHYFGSKDEVLRQALLWHRHHFFAATNRNGRGPDYFELSRYPGFVRAVTWAAIDRVAIDRATTGRAATGRATTGRDGIETVDQEPDGPVIPGRAGFADDHRPSLEFLLGRVAQRYGTVSTDQRIAVLTSVATQMAWVLLAPSVEQELGYPVDRLAPQAAALLHRLVTES
jgi:AcrR family transcriptional regulator